MKLHRSSITWCDFSGGPLNIVVRGQNDCPCSDGCDNCYVPRSLFGRLPERTTFYPERLAKLARADFDDLQENRRGPGSRPICFLCDTGDILHPSIPLYMATSIVECVSRLAADFVLLTKRSHRLPMLDLACGGFPDNVWVLATACNQAEVDRKIPHLLQVGASVRGICLEPMLGPVDLSRWFGLVSNRWGTVAKYRPDVNWVIVGAESGPNRREFKPVWAQFLYEQCHAAGVTFFGKQDSHYRPGWPLLLYDGQRIGEIHEWPEARK